MDGDEPSQEPRARAERGSIPLPLVASAAALVAIIGAALAHSSFLFAAYLALVAVIPVFPGERSRVLGIGLAWAGLVVSVVAAARVPLGARVTVVYLPSCVALLARIVALRTASVKRWSLGSSGSAGV